MSPIVPRVSPTPLQTPLLSAGSPAAPSDAAFGGGQGNVAAAVDLSPIAREAAQIAAEQRATTMQAVLDDARLRTGQLRQGIAAHYETLSGLDAPAHQEAYRAAWTDGVAKIRVSLPSDELRAAYDHAVVGDDLDLNDRLVRHSLAETQAADHDTYTGSRQLLLNDVTAHAGDDAATAATIGRLNDLTRDYGARRGEPPQLIASEIARDTSSAHAQVIDTLTAAGDLRAAPYLEAHADEMLGADRIQATKAVHVLTIRSASQKDSDKILFGGPAFPTLTDAMAQVRAIADPEERDATEVRVQQAFTQKRQADHDAQDDTMIDAGNRLDQSTGDLHTIPAAQWASLAPAQKQVLQRYADSLRNGDSIATDWKVYNSLVTQASTKATEGAFLQENLTDYMAQLARPELKQLIDWQGRLRSADADTARQELGQVRTTNQVVTDGLHAIGIGINPAHRKQDDPVINDVFANVAAQVAALQEREQRKATTAEVQAITNDLLTQHVVSGPGYFGIGTRQTTKRTFELGPDDSLVLTAKDIPAAQLPALDQWLQAHGQAATDANRVTAYSTYLKTLTTRGPR